MAAKLEVELRTRFIPIPKVNCPCGRLVVFIHRHKTRECSRCGRKWELIIKTKEVKNRGKRIAKASAPSA